MKKYKKDPVKSFFSERNFDIKSMNKDLDLKRKSIKWMIHADKYNILIILPGWVYQ